MSSSYPCVLCKSPGLPIMQGSTPESTKLKCRNCGMMYTAADSHAKLRAANEPIPEAEPTGDPRSAQESSSEVSLPIREQTNQGGNSRRSEKLPRTLAFVIVSKDRGRYEFVNKKQLKKTILQWEASEIKYEVFELSLKAVQAKVDIN